MIRTIAKAAGILLVIAALTAAGGRWWLEENLKGIEPGVEKEVKIPDGATGRDVAEILKGEGLIRDSLAFRIALRKYLPGGGIMSGRYRINSSSSAREIIGMLEKGTITLNLVTVPEGLTKAQIAEIFAGRGLCSKEDFLKEAEKPVMIDGREEKTEGFLLPDTYDVPKEYGAAEIIGLMTKSFDEYYSAEYEKLKGSLPVKLSLQETVTLASMVEREAKLPSERPLIAGVYYNRLKNGMRLECDATIQYALGKQKEALLYSDLEIDSPYNTYRREGLPPGPIANPGRDALKAALHPARHGYYFYVLNEIKGDGSHVFTENAYEHEQAVRKYLK